MADEKVDAVVDSSVNEFLSEVVGEQKAQDVPVTESGPAETKQDAEVPAVEPLKIKLRGGDYTPEEFVKAFPAETLEEALDAAENRRAWQQSLTNAQKEAAEAMHAAGVPIKFLQKIATMRGASNMREMLVEEFGEEIGKEFDALKTFNAKEIKHPAQVKLEALELEQRKAEGTKVINAEREKLVKDFGLTEAEMKQVNADAYDLYVATCPLDEAGNPILEKGDYGRASLTIAFEKSPLFRQKIEARIKADIEAKAAKEKKEADAAVSLKNGQPPLKKTGVSTTVKTPKTMGDIAIPDDLANDILLHLNGG